MPNAPVAPTLQTGRMFKGSSNAFVHSDLIDLDYGDRIWKFYKDKYPTSSAVMKVRSKPVQGSTFFHFEHDGVPQYAQIAGAETSSSTTIDVISGQGKRFIANDLWVNLRTWDGFKVTSISTDAVTAVRGIGPGVAQAMVAGDRLRRVSPVGVEGMTAPDTVTSLEVMKTFYTQDFRTSVELTSRLRATKMRVEPNLLKRIELERLDVHKQGINTSYFWGGGSRTGGAASAGEQTFTNGCIGHIKTNTWNVNGGLSWGDIATFIAGDIAPWNPSRVLTMYTSAHVKNIINNYALDKLQLTAGVKSWGIDIDNLVVIGGRKVAIVEEPLFNESPEMQGMAIIGSLGLSAWRGFDQTMPNDGAGATARSTRLYRDILKDDNPAAYKGEWFTSGGWEFFAERAWGLVYNIKF